VVRSIAAKPGLSEDGKMKLMHILSLSVMCLAGATVMAADSAHEFKLKSIDGEEVALSEYKGKVLMIVNVASQCGLTPQYEQLQALHDKYHEQGLVVIGVPCNQFGEQEPGSEKEIKKFCSDKYKVTFPMMSKIDVNGEKEDPLYTWLKENSDNKDKIKWNFAKFIVGKDGKVISRVDPRTRPDADDVVSVIEKALKAE
jgi:glutathione peroxidase